MSQIINIQSIIEQKIDLSQARQMIILYKGEIFTFFDEGCSRHVFVNADESKVIKIQKHSSTNFNKDEFDIYTNAVEEDKVLMTPTYMFNDIIEQEFCTPIKFGGKKLDKEQREFALSCRNEVGWNKEGSLVCFDLDEFKKY